MNKSEMMNLGIIPDFKRERECNSRGIPNYLQTALGWLKRYDKTGDNIAIANYHHYIRVAEEFGMCQIIEPVTFEDEDEA